MIKLICKLLFKAKRLSFKNGDIIVIKVPTNTHDFVIANITCNFRNLLDKLGYNNTKLCFLRNDMDIFVLDNKSIKED